MPEFKKLDLTSDIGSGTLKPRIDLLAALSNDTNVNQLGGTVQGKKFQGAIPCVVFLERRSKETKSSRQLRKTKSSQFGRLLTVNYKYNGAILAPPTRTVLVNKLIKRFDFSTASPDDIKIQFFQNTTWDGFLNIRFSLILCLLLSS